MRRRGGTVLWIAGLAILMVQTAVHAGAPDRSPRPEPRGGARAIQPVTPPAAVVVRYDATIRPKPRSGWSPLALRGLLGDAPAAASRAAPATTGLPDSVIAAATGGGPIVRFFSEQRPQPRPWLDRSRPVGSLTAPAVLVPPTPVLPTQPIVPRGGQVLASTPPVFNSPRPLARPANLQRRATVVAAGFGRVAPAAPQSLPSGAICGDPNIRGRQIPAIAGTAPGCGIADPVQVTEVHGIRLSVAATMDCETARALGTWVQRGAIPTIGNSGGGIAQFRVAAHYACRPRNSQPGARISEHGKGRAIDISAIQLRNGETITILDGWSERRNGRMLRAMWQSACGPFGTVLGPDANRFHLDHFHFDTARYRSGPYCR